MDNLPEIDWNSISYLSDSEDGHNEIEITYNKGLFRTLFRMQPKRKVYIQLSSGRGIWFDNENGLPTTPNVQEMLDKIKQRFESNNLKHVNGEM